MSRIIVYIALILAIGIPTGTLALYHFKYLPALNEVKETE